MIALGGASGLGLVGAAVRRVVDLALPNRCVGCRAVIGADGALCPACFARLDFIVPPLCRSCGIPLPSHGAAASVDLICAACSAHPPAFDSARAALVYGGLGRDIVLMLKHADRTDLAKVLAVWLARAGTPLLAQATLIVPVPLHPRRLAQRRFNQAGLLAQVLARTAHLPCMPDLLRRTRPTPSQGGFSAAGRRRNVQGAFGIAPRSAARVKRARVLLVDDVMTTGATLDACARVLRRAGADAVDAVVVARVLRADPDLDSPEDESI